MNQSFNFTDLQIEIDDLVNQRLIIENSKLEKINNLILRQRRGLSMNRRNLLRKRSVLNIPFGAQKYEIEFSILSVTLSIIYAGF